MGSQLATWSHGIVQTCAAAKGLIWIMVLLQLESMLTFVTHVATKGHKDAQCLGYHLWLYRCQRATRVLTNLEWSALPHCAMVTSRTKLKLRAMSESMVLL